MQVLVPSGEGVPSGLTEIGAHLQQEQLNSSKLLLKAGDKPCLTAPS